MRSPRFERFLVGLEPFLFMVGLLGFALAVAWAVADIAGHLSGRLK